jgi:hypothetical protein
MKMRRTSANPDIETRNTDESEHLGLRLGRLWFDYRSRPGQTVWVWLEPTQTIPVTICNHGYGYNHGSCYVYPLFMTLLLLQPYSWYCPIVSAIYIQYRTNQSNPAQDSAGRQSVEDFESLEAASRTFTRLCSS